MRYNNRSDGTAMNTRITAGVIVQVTSVICPSNINRMMFLLKVSVIIIYATTLMIILMIISAWSWNEINCSITGDALSCRFIFAHVVIYKKKL
jgi:hypothetical protein